MEEVQPGEQEVETELRATTERIESLEAESTKGNWVWKRYNREPQRMETHLRNVTKTTKSPEAELTEAICALQRGNRKKRRLKKDPGEVLYKGSCS
jgi:predicted nuclease with TOPRIM domain